VNFRGEKRSNATHQSTTDPEARLYQKAKGQEAKLSFLGHGLRENRNGLVVDTNLTLATGTTECEAALDMVQEQADGERVTRGADKNYDTHAFVKELREQGVTPHVAQNNRNRSRAIDARTTRHPGYAVSQKKRKWVEEIFAWMKMIGLMRKVRHRGRKLVEWMFTYTATAYNLMRMLKLTEAST
jgi:IS5 family transposase